MSDVNIYTFIMSHNGMASIKFKNMKYHRHVYLYHCTMHLNIKVLHSPTDALILLVLESTKISMKINFSMNFNVNFSAF